MIRVIENDLRALSLEARRRFPEVKEAAARALQRLKTAQESLPESASLAEQAAVVASSEEVLLPFTLALATRSDALPLCALGAVQRMISHGAVAPPRLPAIASQLIARATAPSVKHQNTFCQMGMSLASSPEAVMMSSVIEPESEDVRK